MGKTLRESVRHLYVYRRLNKIVSISKSWPLWIVGSETTSHIFYRSFFCHYTNVPSMMKKTFENYAISRASKSSIVAMESCECESINWCG